MNGPSIYVEVPDRNGRLTQATHDRSIELHYEPGMTFHNLIVGPVFLRYGPNGVFVVNGKVVAMDERLDAYGLNRGGQVIYRTPIG